MNDRLSEQASGRHYLELVEDARALLNMLVGADGPVGKQLVQLSQTFPQALAAFVRSALDLGARKAGGERPDSRKDVLIGPVTAKRQAA